MFVVLTNNICTIVVMSLLTNPSDGKLDNFMGTYTQLANKTVVPIQVSLPSLLHPYTCLHILTYYIMQILIFHSCTHAYTPLQKFIPIHVQITNIDQDMGFALPFYEIMAGKGTWSTHPHTLTLNTGTHIATYSDVCIHRTPTYRYTQHTYIPIHPHSYSPTLRFTQGKARSEREECTVLLPSDEKKSCT